jgi:regulator of RNase E activity RraA
MDCMTKTIVPHIGDVKAFNLKQRGAEGMVSDGSVRDLTAVLALGIKVFSAGNGIAAGTEETDQYEANVPIGCGGVFVRPGDLIVGDDGGVVVVPQEVVLDVLEFAEDHSGAEEYIKELAAKENVPTWTYYPPNDAFIARYKREKLGQS